MAKKKAKPPDKSKQRALVIGVSEYPDPADHLPAVAADVREMAKVLSSKHGTFTKPGVTVLTDRQATHEKVRSSLQRVFTNATANETVFVYLAGHGDVVGDDYFFIAHDTDGNRLDETGVSLRDIRALFEATRSRRVFLWLDFCHSGGILARGTQSDISAIRRAIGVVSGQGKIIVAACTKSQSAYEDSSIGHGLFTDALLRGLKGEAKSAHGEVTALSLYEYIDHQVSSGRQQPVFFGEMTGRIVLMHYEKRAASPKKKTAKKKAPSTAKKPGGKKSPGTWVMLGENFLAAEKVRQHSDGRIELVIVPQSGEDEAAIAALRPTRFGGTRDLPFAANNDACQVQVEEVVSETVNAKQVWSVSLKAMEQQPGFGNEVNVQGIGPDEIARRRVGRMLLNDPPPQTTRGYDNDAFVDSFISGSMTGFEIKECIVRSVYQQHGQTTAWKDFARLKSIYLMKMTGTVEHILELKIGVVRGGKVPVSFRGRRPQHYSNVPPETIEVKGTCSLS